MTKKQNGGVADLHRLANQIAEKGRHGDSVLVHMSPEEIKYLQVIAKAHGEELTINPETGLVEAFKLKKLLKSLVPAIVGAVLAPITGGASLALTGALTSAGISSSIAPVLANALVSGAVGGVTSKIQGGNFSRGFTQGAIGSGVGSGLKYAAPYIGQAAGAVGDVIGGIPGEIAANTVGGALQGGIRALLTKQDFSDALASGAFSGATGAGLGLVSKEAQSVLSDLPEPLRNAVISGAIAKFTGQDPLKAAVSALGKPTLSGLYDTSAANVGSGYFEPGGEGFQTMESLSPEEVTRELASLQSRYPSVSNITDLFLGENVSSGVPEWDMASVLAGLPIGNLEQDFTVSQTPTGPVIVDSAGNRGVFVNGEFVLDTGLTPDLAAYSKNAIPYFKFTSGMDPKLTKLFSDPMKYFSTPTQKPTTPEIQPGQVDPQEWLKLNALLADIPNKDEWNPYVLGQESNEEFDDSNSRLMSIFDEGYSI